MNLTEIEETNKAIEAAQKAVKDLKASRDSLIDPADEIKVAEMLHSRKCSRSHEDWCMWFWEVEEGVHNWEGREHIRFRNQARKMLQEESLETINKFFELVDKGW